VAYWGRQSDEAGLGLIDRSIYTRELFVHVIRDRNEKREKEAARYFWKLPSQILALRSYRKKDA